MSLKYYTACRDFCILRPRFFIAYGSGRTCSTNLGILGRSEMAKYIFKYSLNLVKLMMR
jgi:hypothetical protein